MPKRTRTHQLETESIIKFMSLIPTSWVCRKKDHDYGVDVEIEVFNDDDTATGLLAFAQLKATDNAALKDKVSIELDRLKYLQSLDSRSMLVRYCSVSSTFFWIWVSNAALQVDDWEAKSATIHFDSANIWTEKTPAEILRGLKVDRMMNVSSKSVPIGLHIYQSGENSKLAFTLRKALGQLIDKTSSFQSNDDPDKCMPFDVILSDDSIALAIDRFASLEFQIELNDGDEIDSKLAYMLAFMLERVDLNSQAREVVQFILDNNFTCVSREIVVSACLAFLDHPNDALELALRNGLHEQQDNAYGLFLNGMLSSDLSHERKAAAVKGFYAAAISHHEGIGGSPVGVLHYSLANFLVTLGEFGGAIMHFNLARKYHPEYMQTIYFLHELGGLFYFSRHFDAATRCYAASRKIVDEPRTALCEGDCHLYSGDLHAAKACYEVARLGEIRHISSDAELKIWLCSWLEKLTGETQISARALLRNLDHWAHLSSSGFQKTDAELMLGASLMIGFLEEQSVDAWAQAMLASAFHGDENLLHATFSSSIWRNGYEAYSVFREQSEHNDIEETALAHMDDLVAHFHDERTKFASSGVAIRSVIPNNFDTTVEAK